MALDDATDETGEIPGEEYGKDGTDDQHALRQATLPIIDIAPLSGDDTEARLAVARAIGDAARTSGFFYIAGHGVPDETIEALFAASKTFHEKPRGYKMRYWSGFTTNHRGYVPFEENGREFPSKINFHEAFDLSWEAPEDHPDHLAGWRMTGPNVWPDIDGWRETVSGYYDAVFAVGLRLLDALALSLDVDPAELRKHIDCPTSQLRMMRYLENTLPSTKDFVGIDAHSDFECFTILLQGGPGLQVMNGDDFWVEAPPVPGCFIVNVGDIFETWSGGRFRSTQHRVVNTGRERYSFPLFFGLDYHAVVEPLPAFRTPEIVERYPPIKAGDHLMRMSVGAFRYMNEALANGEIPLEVEVPEKNPFKRTAKVIETSA